VTFLTQQLTRARSVSLGLVLVLVIAYASSAPRTLPEADSGEFAALAMQGGIAHPPGYPLHVVVLQLFAHLAPVLGLIPALVLPSILETCAAAWLMLQALLGRGWRPIDAGVSTLVAFLSVNVWRAATSFEPFALNLLLGAAVIYFCHRCTRAELHGKMRPGWLLFCIGASFGLGLCNHHSLVFLAPLPLAVVLSQPRAFRRDLLWLFIGFVAGATPLLLLLMLRNQPGWIWGDWDVFMPRLITHLLRREYGTFTLSSSESHGHLAYGPVRMLATLPAALSYVFFAVLLLGIASGVRACWVERARPDAFVIGAGLAFITSGLVLPMLFGLVGTPLDNLIADRFLALPMLPLILPLANGVRALRPMLPRFQTIVLLALLASHVGFMWPRAARNGHHFYEDHIRNIIAIAETGATLIVVADGGFSGGLYARYVLNRPDVQLVVNGFGWPWYLKRMSGAFGWVTGSNGQLVATHRAPLYLLDVPKTARTARPVTYPVGPLLRVVVNDTTLPSAIEVFELNRALFAKLRLPTAWELQRLDAWEADELTNYYRAWDMIGKRLESEGIRDLAVIAYHYRDAFAPARH
jgi:hypothetical protein